MPLNFKTWLQENAPAESRLFRFFRVNLKFGPCQGGDGHQPNFKGAAKALCLSNDLLADRAALTRNEGLPRLCSETGLYEHATERGISKLPTESMAEFRINTAKSGYFHAITGRRGGFERAIKRATDKPFTLKSFGRSAFRLGSPGFGNKGWGAAICTEVITFHHHLEEEELAAVKASVEACGQALRDEVIYVNPALPMGRWKLGSAGFGNALFGPEE